MSYRAFASSIGLSGSGWEEIVRVDDRSHQKKKKKKPLQVQFMYIVRELVHETRPLIKPVGFKHPWWLRNQNWSLRGFESQVWNSKPSKCEDDLWVVFENPRKYVHKYCKFCMSLETWFLWHETCWDEDQTYVHSIELYWTLKREGESLVHKIVAEFESKNLDGRVLYLGGEFERWDSLMKLCRVRSLELIFSRWYGTLSEVKKSLTFNFPTYELRFKILIISSTVLSEVSELTTVTSKKDM